MNAPPASWSASVPANGAAGCDSLLAVPAGWLRRALGAGTAVTAPAAARMCAGVVPQQPPTRDTPASANRRK